QSQFRRKGSSRPVVTSIVAHRVSHVVALKQVNDSAQSAIVLHPFREQLSHCLDMLTGPDQYALRARVHNYTLAGGVALGVVTVQELRWRPPVDLRRQLPPEIHCVAQPGA